MKKNKLSLEDLRVTSFTTKLSDKEVMTVAGGDINDSIDLDCSFDCQCDIEDDLVDIPPPPTPIIIMEPKKPKKAKPPRGSLPG